MKKTGIVLALIACIVVVIPAQLLQHEVREGETLYGIARRYDLTVDQLTTGNRLESPDLLLPGTLLTIPNRYRVERGDTLYSIARTFETTVESLNETNGLTSSAILIGQIITLPEIVVPKDEPVRVARQEKVDEKPPKSTDSRDGRIVVAAEVSQPLDFASGGIWPVAGSRSLLEGKLPGVLIRTERGAPVYAIASGRVVYAGPHTTFGNVVFVQSPQDYIYVYGGQESVQVAVGDLINAGSAIGTVGISPSEGRGALYFTVWQNNRFVDPETAPRG